MKKLQSVKRLPGLLSLLILWGVGGGFSSAQAQTYAQLKLWDSHERYPLINEIEFEGADSSLATYDAIYGHGAMMENEYYGLRVYMDHRQSVDLYGKRMPQIELPTTNFYSTAEHRAQGYGEDILFVGGSIGAGSFRGYEQGQPTFLQPVAARGQRVRTTTPDSASIEVWCRDWMYKGQPLQLLVRYSMFKGRRETLVDVYLTGCSDSMVFVTGVQKLESNSRGICQPNKGLVASWGTNVPDKAHPELSETLGMAVRVSREYLYGTTEDDLNYLCLVHPVDGHIQYRLYVAPDMEREGGFHDADSWFTWLKDNMGIAQ